MKFLNRIETNIKQNFTIWDLSMIKWVGILFGLIVGAFNATFIKNEKTERSKDPDLWMGQKKCSSEILISALREEKVWRFLDDFWDVRKEINRPADLDALGYDWWREFPF